MTKKDKTGGEQRKSLFSNPLLQKYWVRWVHCALAPTVLDYLIQKSFSKQEGNVPVKQQTFSPEEGNLDPCREHKVKAQSTQDGCANSNANPLMLLVCSVNTPIHRT